MRNHRIFLFCYLARVVLFAYCFTFFALIALIIVARLHIHWCLCQRNILHILYRQSLLNFCNWLVNFGFTFLFDQLLNCSTTFFRNSIESCSKIIETWCFICDFQSWWSLNKLMMRLNWKLFSISSLYLFLQWLQISRLQICKISKVLTNIASLVFNDNNENQHQIEKSQKNKCDNNYIQSHKHFFLFCKWIQHSVFRVHTEMLIFQMK